MLWSNERRNLAEFRRRDYLEPPELPLAEAVRRRAKQERVRSSAVSLISSPALLAELAEVLGRAKFVTILARAGLIAAGKGRRDV